MDHRLFKRVSAASATQFVPLFLFLFLSVPLFSLLSPSLSLTLTLLIQLSPPEISAFAFSPSFPHSHLLLLLSLSPIPPPTLPPSPSLLLDACLHEGCRLEPQVDWEAQIKSRTYLELTKMLMNDNITATLNRHFSDSLYLCLSLLGNYFLFSFFFKFSFVWLCR